MSTTKAYLFCLSAGLIWGFTFSLARIAADAGGHPMGLALWQAAVGAVTLILVCLVRGKRPPRERRFIWLYPLLAFLGTAAPGTVYYIAASRVPSGVLAITIALVPILTYALSVPLGLDRPSRWRLVGIIAGLLGVALLLGPETSLPDRSMVPWLLLAFGAVVMYSIENVVVPLFVPDGASMIGLLTGMQCVATLMLAVVVWRYDAWVPLDWPFTVVEWSIIGMGIVSAIAYSMFLVLLQGAGPVFAAQIGYVSTLSGVFWGLMIFSETHSPWVWGSLTVIMLGLFLVNPRAAD